MMFGELTADHMEVAAINGRKYSVPLLPVHLIDVYVKIVKNCQENPTPKEIAAARAKLRKMAMNVLPPELEKDLLHQDYSGICKIILKLFYGSAKTNSKNTIDESGQQKLHEELDCEFCAARMLSVFPGYTLESLLNLPAPVFFRLAALSCRVQADKAICENLPAYVAGQGSKEAFTALQKLHGGYTITVTGGSGTSIGKSSKMTPELFAKLKERGTLIVHGQNMVVEEIKIDKNNRIFERGK